jgi:hypothetical protein
MKLKKLLILVSLIFSLCILATTSEEGVAAQNEILILFSDTKHTMPINKDTTLYDPKEWYLEQINTKYKVGELLKEGWTLLQIVPLNVNQHSWIFVKDGDKVKE